jgi:hypothetical protein
VVSGDGRTGVKRAAGYEVVKRTDSQGEPVRGERKINEAEAAIVRRIFRSPRWGNRRAPARPIGTAMAFPAIGRTMYAAIDDALLVITPQDKCCLGSNAKVALITHSWITGTSQKRAKNKVDSDFIHRIR